MWKILKEMGISDHLTCLLRNLNAGQEATVKTRHGKQTGSKLGKVYVKAVYCQLLYLISMQNTSCEMLGWMKHKLESRLLREISITSDYAKASMLSFRSTLISQSKEELKSLLKVKEESEKADLKLNIQKTKIMAFGPMTSWQIEGEKWKQ